MTLYFDENMPRHLVRAFEEIQKFESRKDGIPLKIAYIPSFFGKGVKDEDWIPQLESGQSFVITQDINITRRKQELALYRKQQIGLFLVRAKSKKKGIKVWEMLETLAKNWPFIVQTIANKKPPFAWTIQANGRTSQID